MELFVSVYHAATVGHLRIKILALLVTTAGNVQAVTVDYLITVSTATHQSARYYYYYYRICIAHKFMSEAQRYNELLIRSVLFFCLISVSRVLFMHC